MNFLVAAITFLVVAFTPAHNAEAWQLAHNAAVAVGHPEIAAVTYSIGYWESRWSQHGLDWTGCSVGDYGSSYGEHQWHKYGLGMPYSKQVLCNRAESYRLISEYIAVHLNAGYELEDILRPWSVRRMAREMAEEMGDW